MPTRSRRFSRCFRTRSSGRDVVLQSPDLFAEIGEVLLDVAAMGLEAFELFDTVIRTPATATVVAVVMVMVIVVVAHPTTDAVTVSHGVVPSS
jgi:hypothetical protein